MNGQLAMGDSEGWDGGEERKALEIPETPAERSRGCRPEALVLHFALHLHFFFTFGRNLLVS